MARLLDRQREGRRTHVCCKSKVSTDSIPSLLTKPHRETGAAVAQKSKQMFPTLPPAPLGRPASHHRWGGASTSKDLEKRPETGPRAARHCSPQSRGVPPYAPRLGSQILMPPSRSGLGLRWRWKPWLPGLGSRQQHTAALMQLHAMFARES